MKKYFKVCLVLTAMFFLTVCCALAEEFTFTKTATYVFEQDMNNGKIEISTVNGSVKILPAKDNNCKIEISYAIKEKDKLAAETLANNITKLIKSNGKLTCNIKYPKEKIKAFGLFNKNSNDSIKASVTAYLPARYMYGVELDTVNGNVASNGLKFNLIDAATVNGKIELNTVAKNIKTSNVNGDIILNISALLESNTFAADTVNGAVSINTKKQKNTGYELKITTVTGKIHSSIENFATEESGGFFGVGNSFEGKTNNFDKEKYKVTIKAHTVNGKVTVTEE